MFRIRVSCSVSFCASIWAGCECQRTTLSSIGKMLQMWRSINETPSRVSTVGCRATPNQIRVFSSPRNKYGRINLPKESGFLVTVRTRGMCLRLMRIDRLGVIIDERMRFTPAFYMRRQLAVRMGLTKISYVIRSLSDVLVVSAISVDCIGNLCGSDNKTWFFILRLGKLCLLL